MLVWCVLHTTPSIYSLHFELSYIYMVVSQNRGPQYRPQNIVVLIVGTPKVVHPILGNPHMYIYIYTPQWSTVLFFQVFAVLQMESWRHVGTSHKHWHVQCFLHFIVSLLRTLYVTYVHLTPKITKQSLCRYVFVFHIVT